MDLGMGLGLSRGDGSVGGGATPHPLAGSGMTWWSAEDSDLFEDTSGTDPIEGTDGETVKRINVSEGSDYAYHSDAGTNYKYGAAAGSHAINSKPTVYISGVNSTSGGMLSDAVASAILTGKEFDLIAVVRRVDADDNQSLFIFGNDVPMSSRQYSGNVVRLYSWGGGYVEVNNNAFTTGVHVLHYRFNDTTNLFSVAVDGGTAVTVSEGGAWSPSGAAGLALGQADIDYACMGIYDGLHGDVAGLVTDLKTYYGIA